MLLKHKRIVRTILQNSPERLSVTLLTYSSHHARVEDLHLEVVVLRGERVRRDVNSDAPVFVRRIAGRQADTKTDYV